MKFLVITHVIHKKSNDQIFAYAPYVREMNLWGMQVSNLSIIAPLSNAALTKIDLAYTHPNLYFRPISALDFTSRNSTFRSVFTLPYTVWQIFQAMRHADHIHLRCPGNMGLIGCFVQIFFPNKPKTAKYAGNWDWNSQQPWSYRLQQRMLRNTFLTRNMTALVYGDWTDRTRNILPFFTASYSKQEAVETLIRPLEHSATIRLIFVGTLSSNKRPLLAVETVKLLKSKGFQVQLDLFGEGPEREVLATEIMENKLQNEVILHGNVSVETLKEAYQSAHFLLFASKSEGWPKAVAEAMFWRCLPITTPVSCVPQMLGHGSRGDLVAPDASAMSNIIMGYLEVPEVYSAKCTEAMEWSRQYTLEFFEAELDSILQNGKNPASY